MPPTLTAIYASLLALLFLALSARVIFGRFRHRVSVGDGGDKDMLKRMRVQANCAEYAPIGILMLGLAEMQGMGPALLHLFGLMLLAGRTAHAYGFGRTPQISALRIGGMVLTVAMITLTAIGNLFLALA
ncbi:MAPEG family protein [Psychromarinibacter sp. S121]|uniref:MAPEG family protein n=1 Tax=Psychromarinibacter sp. S121 TaxID=3415127 RepID=UPI003C7D66BA